jgi:hypothetical protein
VPRDGGSVTIDSSASSPASLKAEVGQSVTRTNKQQGVPHTVTADGGAFDHPMPSGATFSFTFTKAGTFAYHRSIIRRCPGRSWCRRDLGLVRVGNGKLSSGKPLAWIRRGEIRVGWRALGGCRSESEVAPGEDRSELPRFSGGRITWFQPS